MDHHGTDDGGVAPGTGRGGPGSGPGAPGGPGARAGGIGPATGRVRPPGRAVPAAADVGNGADADGVWAVLLERHDPVSAQELAAASELKYTTALAALLAFEQAGYVLRIPDAGGSRPHPELWVLAGGVREGLAVADAVRAGLLEKLDSSEPAELPQVLPPRPAPRKQAQVAVGPVTGNLVLPRGGLKELVLALLVERYPSELGPAGMAKLLDGRSAGAIRNAADALCKEGKLVCTDEAVRRYAALKPDGGCIESPFEPESLA